MKILVTGGCGYKGAVLVPKLLEVGHEIDVIDNEWFGNPLAPHPRLFVRQLDVRHYSHYSLVGYDAIIHLANIANDPCGDLDAKLTWEVNALATTLLADNAARAGVKQFIFASSASVYGIKDNEPVVETTVLEPVSDYNKTKMVAERALLSYRDRMRVQIVRPATVCGVSPRMRFDVMINMLTIQALTKGVITAHCGKHGASLMRPNIHIEDATDLYLWMLERPHLDGIWNAGFENLSALETAKMIQEEIPARLDVTTVKDKRSYCVDSSKLLNAGFRPRHSVREAIKDIAKAYKAGTVKDEDKCRNLIWMRTNGWAVA